MTAGRGFAPLSAPPLDCAYFHKRHFRWRGDPWIKPPVDTSQRRELNKGLGDGFTLAFELVLAPAIFALIGLLIDRALGTTALFAVLLGFLGLVGAVARAYYTYAEQMRQQEEGRPWANSR